MKTMKTNIKNKKGSIGINEEFVACQTKPLDSKHRIALGGKLVKSIGKKMHVEAYQIFVSKNGDILLRPTVSIPSREAWVYHNPQVLGKVRNGLQEAKEGKKERVDDLDSFLDNL
jgi:hypothetical protein